MGDLNSPDPEADGDRAGGGSAADGDGNAATEAAVERRQLMRKVAQLTKVVMHLTSKNDESEQQYHELSNDLENEVAALVEKAVLDLEAQAVKVKELADKTCLPANSERLELLFSAQRQQLQMELQQLQQQAAELNRQQLEMAELEMKVTVQKVQEVSQKLRESLGNYRHTLKRRAQEMEQRHEELRSDRQVELQLLSSDFDRRLEELKGSLRREADHARQSTEHAMLHMRRMHEAETSSQQMALLQRRQERMQRLELDFSEERRMREQQKSQTEMELMQQRKDFQDFKTSLALVDQQVEAMRGTLEEMRGRAERQSSDAEHARGEALSAEAETARLAQEIALLEVRQRSMGLTPGTVGPVPPGSAPPLAPSSARGGSGLTEELREIISNTKQVEHEMAMLEARLGDLEDELAEQDKTVEILEVETEEERLRTHRLQSRIIQLESHLN